MYALILTFSIIIVSMVQVIKYWRIPITVRFDTAKFRYANRYIRTRAELFLVAATQPLGTVAADTPVIPGRVFPL